MVLRQENWKSVYRIEASQPMNEHGVQFITGEVMKKIICCLCLSSLIISVSIAGAADITWLSTKAEAMSQALSQNKRVFLIGGRSS